MAVKCKMYGCEKLLYNEEIKKIIFCSKECKDNYEELNSMSRNQYCKSHDSHFNEACNFCFQKTLERLDKLEKKIKELTKCD